MIFVKMHCCYLESKLDRKVLLTCFVTINSSVTLKFVDCDIFLSRLQLRSNQFEHLHVCGS